MGLGLVKDKALKHEKLFLSLKVGVTNKLSADLGYYWLSQVELVLFSGERVADAVF